MISNNLKSKKLIPRRAGYANLLLRPSSTKKATTTNTNSSFSISRTRRRSEAVVEYSKNCSWEQQQQQQQQQKYTSVVKSRRTARKQRIKNQVLLCLPFDGNGDNVDTVNKQVLNNIAYIKHQHNATTQIENLVATNNGLRLEFLLYDKDEKQHVEDNTDERIEDEFDFDLSFRSLTIE
jgi:hypothetical protein